MEYLEIQLASFPEKKEIFDELSANFNKKLWHQLGMVLEQVLRDDFFSSDQRLIQIHDQFVLKIKDKIKPLTYVKFCNRVSSQYQEPQACLNFLESVMETLKDHKEASVSLQLEMCRCKIRLGELEESKEMLENQKRDIEGFTGIVDASTHAQYHLAALEYHKAKEEANEFYTSALLYLTYVNLDTLRPAEQVALAVDVALAALSGDRVYNFGELLQHPIIKTLEGTENQWLFDTITAFNQGDLNKSKEILAAKGNTQPHLVKQRDFLQQKMRIMCFMEMVFQRGSRNRVLSFQEISQQCDLPLQQVELMLMKSFSLQVVKGLIDEVESQVRVNWVQPRVLNLEQIASLRDRTTTWVEQVKNSAAFVEENSPELLAN